MSHLPTGSPNRSRLLQSVALTGVAVILFGVVWDGFGARAYWNGPWFWSAVTANDSSVQKITLIEARHRVAYMLRKTFDLSGTTAHDVKDARATPRSRYGGWCS